MAEVPEAKRARVSMDDERTAIVAEMGDDGDEAATRTSGLQAPIMLLSGHEAAVYTSKFSPCGRYLASGSHDKRICTSVPCASLLAWQFPSHNIDRSTIFTIY